MLHRGGQTCEAGLAKLCQVSCFPFIGNPFLCLLQIQKTTSIFCFVAPSSFFKARIFKSLTPTPASASKGPGDYTEPTQCKTPRVPFYLKAVS